MHALVIQYLDFAYREIWDRRNQLYFDRVHPVMLIIHQGRYFSRSAETSNPAYVALQYAMWALATCASTQFQDLRERLHAQARLVLEKMDCDEAYSASPCVEQAQAWLLVAHYELCYMNLQRAWITMGRAFRLIQLLGLHDIDRHIASNTQSEEDWTTLEEQRRTFWGAYTLDHYINICNNRPLGLQEETVICHHLFLAQKNTLVEFESKFVM